MILQKQLDIRNDKIIDIYPEDIFNKKFFTMDDLNKRIDYFKYKWTKLEAKIKDFNIDKFYKNIPKKIYVGWMPRINGNIITTYFCKHNDL